MHPLIPWLIQYKYWLIFPIAIIEGPIIMIITGFLASMGIVNFIVALIVVSIGDLVGDSLYYLIGRYGKETFIRKYGKFIGITLERERKIESYFAKHANRSLLIGKFAHGVGSFVLVAAGLAKISYKRLLALNIPSTAVKSAILMLFGYYFGRVSLGLNRILNYLALILLLIFIFIYISLVQRKATNLVEAETEAGPAEPDAPSNHAA